MTRDITHYTILASFGRLGQAFVERDAADCDLETTIRDLMSGQVDHPLRVIAFNVAERWCSDASEDVAREIAARRQPLSQGVIEFIENHAGTQLANQMMAA